MEALRALAADLGASAMRELVGPSWPEPASEKDRAVPGTRTDGRRTASIWHVVEGQSLAVPGIRLSST